MRQPCCRGTAGVGRQKASDRVHPHDHCAIGHPARDSIACSEEEIPGAIYRNRVEAILQPRGCGQDAVRQGQVPVTNDGRDGSSREVDAPYPRGAEVGGVRKEHSATRIDRDVVRSDQLRLRGWTTVAGESLRASARQCGDHWSALPHDRAHETKCCKDAKSNTLHHEKHYLLGGAVIGIGFSRQMISLPNV
jgi:hypothetical protein